MKPVAALILNRNRADITDSLAEHLQNFDGETTDVFVIEAGSDSDKVSRYVTWYADWPAALTEGLRYARGMNFGLSQLWKEGRFDNYHAFFLLKNDTRLARTPSVAPLLKVLDDHPRVGILSPCSRRWGENLLLGRDATRYFWFIYNNALLLRREFLEAVLNEDECDSMNFVFDGSNFRGFCSESELIAKAYANQWSAAITAKVHFEEADSVQLLSRDALLAGQNTDESRRLYVEEGYRWLRKKYGFNSHWSMQQYVKGFYQTFFDNHPEFEHYRI